MDVYNDQVRSHLSDNGSALTLIMGKAVFGRDVGAVLSALLGGSLSPLCSSLVLPLSQAISFGMQMNWR